MCATARMPFEQVRQHPHGKVFDVHEVVRERDTDCRDRLDVGNAYMMDELAEVRSFDFRGARERRLPVPADSAPVQQLHQFLGPGRRKAAPGKRVQPGLHAPRRSRRLDLTAGDRVTIRSPHDFIPSIVEADDTVRRKVIAMHHGFGGLVDEDHKFTDQGSNVGRLVANDRIRPDHGHPPDGQHPGERDAGLDLTLQADRPTFFSPLSRTK